MIILYKAIFPLSHHPVTVLHSARSNIFSRKNTGFIVSNVLKYGRFIP